MWIIRSKSAKSKVNHTYFIADNHILKVEIKINNIKLCASHFFLSFGQVAGDTSRFYYYIVSI